MSKLTSLLEYMYADKTKQKDLAESEAFKASIGEKSYKTLLQSEAKAITDTTLVQEEVYNKIVEGTQPVKCMREVTPLIKADSYSIRIVKGQTGTYADEIPEAGIVPIDNEKLTKTDITIKKYGTRPLITNELIEDSLFDVIDLELKRVGAKLENKLNRVVLKAILDGVTTNTMSPGGDHFAVTDIAAAVAKVKKYNYIPDILVTHPTAEGYLLQDSNLAYVSFAGTSSPLTQGKVPKLISLTPYTCTATDLDSGPVWDDTTAGSDVTAMVFSKADLGMLAMRRDVTVEQYDDPIHDLIGISATMRYGYGVINETSGCMIYHK